MSLNDLLADARGQVNVVQRLIILFVFAVVGVILGSELLTNTDDPSNASLSQSLLDLAGGFSTAMGLLEIVFIVLVLSAVLLIVSRIGVDGA